MNVQATWNTLVKGLQLGDGRQSPERIIRALDTVETNTRRAGTIYQAAMEELEEFDLHFSAVSSKWNQQARDQLEKLKADKRYSGQVTKDAIEGWVAANVPAYTEWRRQRRDHERARNQAKHLYEAWTSRSATLRKMADIVEKRRGIDPNMLNRREV